MGSLCGYLKSILNRALSIAKKTPRDELLKDKKKKDSQNNSVPVFFTLYRVEFNKIRNIIEKYLPILFNNPVYTG